ncbi:MAG: hypothetical protein VBE63_30565, partial [Lamprobacter sp.]|uniref:hypothetical protein n=1 Tax=Lamprobacter sp. TaxID=3100796 RepID=UPI002B264068
LKNGAGTTTNNSLSYSVSVAAGTATVTLSGGTLAAADLQTLIDGISYSNSSQNPSTASNRVVTITSIQDSGGTANGGVDTAAPNIGSTVTLVAVNDAPVIANLDADNPSFVVGADSPVKLDAGDAATVTDVDHSNFGNSGFLLVSQSSSGSIATGDLSFDGTTVKAGDDGVVTSGERVTVNGTDIGAVTTIATADGTIRDLLKITFDNGAATPALVSTLLQNLSYTETLTNTAIGDRRFDISVYDGEESSSVATVTLTGAAAPTITSATYDWASGQLRVTG